MKYKKKEHSLKVSRTEGKLKGKYLKIFKYLLLKLTIKVSVEKAWLLYEFPFSLNPGDQPLMHRYEKTIHHYIH